MLKMDPNNKELSSPEYQLPRLRNSSLGLVVVILHKLCLKHFISAACFSNSVLTEFIFHQFFDPTSTSKLLILHLSKPLFFFFCFLFLLEYSCSVLCDDLDGWDGGGWEGGSRESGYIYIHLFDHSRYSTSLLLGRIVPPSSFLIVKVVLSIPNL